MIKEYEEYQESVSGRMLLGVGVGLQLGSWDLLGLHALCTRLFRVQNGCVYVRHGSCFSCCLH